MQAISLFFTMGIQHNSFCCNSWNLLNVRFANEYDFAFSCFIATGLTKYHFYCIRYIGDENGLLSVLRYNSDDGKLLRLPYCLPAMSVIGNFFSLIF